MTDRAVLDRAAPGLYWLFLDTFADQVILEAARMLDPPITAGQQNASYDLFETVVTPHLPTAIMQSFSAHLAQAKLLAKGLRERRNKQLAHCDFAVATGQALAGTAVFTREDLKQCLEELAACLNDVYSHFESFAYPYSDPMPPYNNSLAHLLETLRAI